MSTCTASSYLNTYGNLDARRYDVIEELGRGCYGVVNLAYDTFQQNVVAVKSIDAFRDAGDATRILREMKLLRLLKHQNIVELKHIVLPTDPCEFTSLHLVFERMDCDLKEVMSLNYLSLEHVAVYMYQLLRGLDYMHRSGVLHRDLKPANILVNENNVLKICDLGLSRLTSPHQLPVVWSDYVATRWYRAPELCGLFYSRYTAAVDIWSVGCIFAELLRGCPLFPGKDATSQLDLITDLLGKPSPDVVNNITNHKARAYLHAMPPKHPKSLHRIFPQASQDALSLLSQLLAFNPAKRPSARQAMAHPFFAALHKDNDCNAIVLPLPPEEFEFDRRALSVPEVRSLMYDEITRYHPTVATLLRKTGWLSFQT